MLPVHHRSKLSITSYSTPGSSPDLGFTASLVPTPAPYTKLELSASSFTRKEQLSPGSLSFSSSSPLQVFTKDICESEKLYVLRDRRPDSEFVPWARTFWTGNQGCPGATAGGCCQLPACYFWWVCGKMGRERLLHHWSGGISSSMYLYIPKAHSSAESQVPSHL